MDDSLTLQRGVILKRISIASSIILTLIIPGFLYISMNGNAEYISLGRKQLPISIQKKLQENNEGEKFNIYYDEKFTYVIFKAEHKTNEYIKTDLTLNKFKGKYVVNGVIDIGTDESNVSYEKISRFKKVPSNVIELKEIDKR